MSLIPTGGNYTTVATGTTTSATVTTTTAAISTNSVNNAVLTSGGNWTNIGFTGNVSGSFGHLVLSGKNPKLKIDEGEIDLRELLFLMREMKERLLLIEEDMKRHEEYPALKSIYDQYKVVEAMVKSDEE